MIDEREMTLAILAGGEGSRIGVAKSLLRINDQPILEFLLDQFAWAGETLLVTAPSREHPPAHKRFTREVIDTIPGQGPLRGVLTALENLATEHAVIAPLDMPLLRREQILDLVGHWRSDDRILMPERNIGRTRQIEPFPSIFHRDVADEVRRRLDAAHLSVRGLSDLSACRVVAVDWEPSVWLNLNHPSDLHDLQKLNLRMT